MDEETKDIQSLGGKARAEKLTKEQRKEIASTAALARWSKEGTQYPLAKYGSPDRPLKIGDVDIPCYVLDDGRRVITQGGMLLGLEMSAGTATKGGGDRLTNFATTKSIKPFISDNLMEMIKNPIRFRGHGSLAYGYEATILAEICEAILACRQAGELNHQQEHIAKKAEVLVRAFAKVGIVALVDEATGYQETRNREALQEILKRFISEELLEWVRTFPTDFYKQIFRLKGWNWNDGRMSPIVGSIVNDLVYARLAPGVLEELKKRNPVENGTRKHKHFQHLTKDIGHPELTRHLYELIGMARAFSTGQWDQYYRLVNQTFQKMNTTGLLPFEADKV
jgi:hypothetical protein